MYFYVVQHFPQMETGGGVDDDPLESPRSGLDSNMIRTTLGFNQQAPKRRI